MDWQDIKGHAQIKQDLISLLQEDKLPHALLFTGEEGIGKALTAHVLAKALLCLSKDSHRPCDICRSCRAFEENTHPDFFCPEPDGKSVKMIKIDQIRQLQAALSLSPDLSARRVVIIDGAEFMNETAVNSMLKTLEEPQGEIFFILTTANKDMLLPTVLSRCTKIYFAPLSEAETADILVQKYAAEPDRAAVIAQLAGGSISRAVSLIDSSALELRDKAMLLFTDELSDAKILALSAELGTLERSQLVLWASFIQMLVRDALLLAGNIEHSLLFSSDKKEQLLAAASLSKITLLKLLELSEQLAKRLNTNADARLTIQKFLLQWRTLQ